MTNPTKKLCLPFFIVAMLCSACDVPATSIEANTINRGLSGDLENFDPQRNTTTQGAQVFSDLFETLVKYSSSGTVENAAALSWQVSPDGLLYTFELRPDLRWSNGEQVVATDYERALKRLISPSTAAYYANYLSAIENASEIMAGELSSDALGVEAIDRRLLEIRLSRPVSYFPQLLTHAATAPIHESQLGKNRGLSPPNKNIVTNGAYKLTGYHPGSIIELSKNHFYWDKENTSIDHIRYFVIDDELAMYNRYRSGDLHIAPSVPSAFFEMHSSDRSTELKLAPKFGIYYYAMNMTKPPFKENLLLRNALSLAVDRETLVKKVTGRGERPAYSFVPLGLNSYTSQVMSYKDMPHQDRIDLAKQLYAQAGYGVGNQARFELRYNFGDGDSRIAVAIQSMWREALGAEAILVNEEFKVLISNIRQKEITQMYRLSWIGDYLDPHNFLQLFESNNPLNLTGYENSEFDNLIWRASHEIDDVARHAVLRQAERMILDDHAVIPLYFYVSKHLVKPEIAGWRDSPVAIHPTQALRIITPP